MTVKDLITKLEKYDPNIQVVFINPDLEENLGYWSIDNIEKKKLNYAPNNISSEYIYNELGTSFVCIE